MRRWPPLPPLCVCVLLVGACQDDQFAGGACCNDSADPVFLQSMIDDDDGDGNPYDEDFPEIDDEDDDIADHTWIRDDAGVFHLFFHTEGLYAPNVIEHYTSTDLLSLHYEGTALTPQPGSWEQSGLWAPHVIREDGVYYMFYTGVNGTDESREERIGLATSADLRAWTRVPATCPGVTGEGCVYECRESWTTWEGPPENFNRQCRDPFVIRDDDARWLLFATTKSTNGFGSVTVAASNDLTHWNGEGYIDATRRLAGGTGAQATGGTAENSFVVTREGVYYLFFTDWQDPEDTVTVANPRTTVQYATSRSLEVDAQGSANWIYRGFTPNTGVNAIEVQTVPCGLGQPVWLMSYSISSRKSGLSPPHRRHLQLKCIRWLGETGFDTENPAFLRDAPRGRGP